MINAKIGDKLTLMREDVPYLRVKPHPFLFKVTKVGNKYLTGYVQHVDHELSEYEQVNSMTTRFDMTLYDIIDHVFRVDLVIKYRLYSKDLGEWKQRQEREERIISNDEHAKCYKMITNRVNDWKEQNPCPVFEIGEELQ